MQRIVPHLWFDKEAIQAAQLYTAAFPNSAIKSQVKISGTPSGEVDILTISLSGYEFQLINAGPYFKLNPSVSFLVNCLTKDEVDQLFKALGDSGSELMPLDAYPFSERYVWLQDKFGLSWQIMYIGQREFRQKIIPTQMFVGEQCGRASEALTFYTSVFHDSAVVEISRYGAGAEPDLPEYINHASFRLENQYFALMESAYPHAFAFNEAISYIVFCDSQAEIDYYWDALTADPAAEQCGWLKDKFGFSWQIVPREMDAMFQEKDPVRLARVTKAFLSMKKFDLEELRRAASL
jgi:predicted 3-demethylubiquinone-9 3-methyltransferase (glyoxalase superfamily)